MRVANRTKPKTDFGIEVRVFTATTGMNMKELAANAGVKYTTLVETTTGRCAGIELIPKVKIAEADLEEPEDKEVLHKRTSVTFSKRRDGWISNLAVVIAENYCCVASVCRYKGKQTYTVTLNGFKSDVEICERVLLFAVEFVRGKNKMRQWSDNYPYSTKEKWAICTAYGEGFTSGLYDKFDKQSRQQTAYAMVLKTPREVRNSLKDCGTLKADFTPTLDGIGYVAMSDMAARHGEGLCDGRNFDVREKLEA